MLVIKDAKIFTSSARGVLENHDILIEDGRIKEISQNIKVDNAQVIDANGLVVIPGIVDAHSHVGGFGVDTTSPDLNEMTNPSTPEVEAIYAIDPSTRDFKRNLESGITTSIITPGSGNVVCGTAFALKSYGNSVDEMCIKNPVALKVAFGGNPKGAYGGNGKAPMTRMAIADILIDTLNKGKAYLEKKGIEAKENLQYNIGMENVIKVLKKEIPLKVHCEQFDILTIIRIAKQFNVDFTIEHGWGASNFIDEIASSGVKGVNFGPIGIHMTPGECGIVDIDSVIELDKRGVLCSLITDGPLFLPYGIILQAGELVRFGLDIETAIKMITLNPAKICDISDRVGSIEVGKDADLAIFNAIPGLNTNAIVEYTIVNGEIAYQK